MRLGDLVTAMDGTVLPSLRDMQVRDVVIDSRKVSPGSLFFALKGSMLDGHVFADQVLDAGGYAVVERPVHRDGAILVADVEKALLLAASWRRGAMDCRVVGITGSSGKTSTRRLLTGAASSTLSVYSTSGNLNNQLGLPMTLLNTPEPVPEVVILEMGMNHAGELTLLGRTARPTDCLVTNIGDAHMEYFGSREGIAMAKAELISQTIPGGVCVIPAGEPILLDEAERRGLSILLSGPGGDGWAETGGSGCRLLPWGIDLHPRMSGEHNCSNAVSAMLMADALGVPPEKAAMGLEQIRPLPGRGRRMRSGRITIVDESYNANPQSMAACLDELASAEGRLGAVLGDMRELGDGAEAYHHRVLEKADSIGLAFLILTGPLFASVASSVKNTEVRLADDWMQALELLRESAAPGCTVLVKGSNSLGLGELVSAMEED